MTKLSGSIFVVAVFLVCAATATLARAQVFTTLVNFDATNGFEPKAVLVQGRSGKLYGTTYSGGQLGGLNGLGTIFDITSTGVLTTLDSFGVLNGPAGPDAGLVLSTDGNFYGTTYGGGKTESSVGTVFKVTPQGALTVLYTFCPRTPCVDGANPTAALVQATDGNFYGTTFDGGTDAAGNVFKITPAGVLTTLHSFDQSGFYPYAGVIQAADCNLYGTTIQGGNNSACEGGCGTVFRVTLGGKFATVHAFGSIDGAWPYAGLIQGNDGALYGVTIDGGTGCASPGCGTIFRITSTGKFQTVHNFNLSDGAYPFASLVQATDGRLYGATSAGGDLGCSGPGGTIGCGTLFAISPDGTLTTLHEFDGIDGIAPFRGLVQATDGTFYGTTVEGGSDGACFYGCGTLFSLDMGLGPFVTFVRFAGKVGESGPILGQGLTGTTSVAINGIQANFTVVSDTEIRATVPEGATTGYVTVTTPTGILTSNVPFRVIR